MTKKKKKKALSPKELGVIYRKQQAKLEQDWQDFLARRGRYANVPGKGRTIGEVA